MDIDKMLDNNQHFHGTKGVILFGDNRTLIYQRDNKTDKFPLYLDLPGGGTEPGESPFDTFRREVEEEFALNVKPDDIVYARRYVSRRQPVHISYFLVAILDPRQEMGIRFGNEGTHYMVMPLTDFLKEDKIIPAHRERIKEYLDWHSHKMQS